MYSRFRAAVAGLLAFACAWAQPAAAERYPSRPITIVVAFAAGGFADGVARTIGNQLSQRLGQPVVVENKGGAGGNLGARFVAETQPDGYTILVSTTSTAINGTLYKKPGYATADLRPAAIVGSAPEAIVVNAGNPAHSLADLLKAGRTAPVEFGTAGIGSGSYIAAEYLFKVIAKEQTIHVPFQGGASGITAVLGNHVPVLAATLPPLVPYINSGKLRGLGIASPQRDPAVPSVPTYAENGIAGFQAASWVGFFVPSKTGDAVLARLSTAINDILKDQSVREHLKRFGLSPMYGTPADAARFFAVEVGHWGKMVKALNLSID